MLRSLIVVLSVVLVVAFLPQGALASDDGIVRQLQTTTQCPTPYVWTQPSWWRKYLRLLKSRVLKKCEFLEGKVPAAGTTCLASQEGNVCLFGEARCNNADEPETKCECTNGIWVCSSVCTQPICPVAMPSGWPNTCDPQVNVKSCNYGEHCCAGSCSSTAFCSCETFQDQSSWLCAIAAMEPCYEKSLEEAGCPCDRPIDGDRCEVDYACGEAKMRTVAHATLVSMKTVERRALFR